jgi:large subunit ribosomal protein L22
VAVVEQERETVRAQARYVRTSARKARLVLEHIRGKPAAEASTILAFHTRAAARDAGKVLASAIANAENNNGHDVDDLFVLTAVADEGPTLKRWRPRARGRVNRIRKRTCHITITLAVAEPGEIRRRPVPVPEPRPRPQAPEVEPVETAPEAPVADEAATEPESAEPEAAEPEAAEPEAKPKPKRAPRARKPKPKPAEGAAEADAAADAEPKPKPKRAPRARKPKAEAKPETTEEEK